MKNKHDHLVQDLFFVAVSIGVAYYLARSGDFEAFITLLGTNAVFGSFIAGFFFTSVFTAIPAVAFITELAPHVPTLPLMLVGALGSVAADYLLFVFLRDRVSADARYLLEGSRGKRFLHVLRRRHFYRFFPLIGVLILVSPLPDEPALAFLGLSRISTRSLLTLSFITHAFGIAVIAFAMQGLG